MSARQWKQRRVRRNKPNRVQLVTGEWVEETELDTTDFNDPVDSEVDTSTLVDETSDEFDTTTIGDSLVCDCGFVAKTAGGLTTHQRSHKEE